MNPNHVAPLLASACIGLSGCAAPTPDMAQVALTDGKAPAFTGGLRYGILSSSAGIGKQVSTLEKFLTDYKKHVTKKDAFQSTVEELHKLFEEYGDVMDERLWTAKAPANGRDPEETRLGTVSHDLLNNYLVMRAYALAHFPTENFGPYGPNGSSTSTNPAPGGQTPGSGSQPPDGTTNGQTPAGPGTVGTTPAEPAPGTAPVVAEPVGGAIAGSGQTASAPTQADQSALAEAAPAAAAPVPTQP